MMGRLRFAVVWALPTLPALPKMYIREGTVEAVCSELLIFFFDFLISFFSNPDVRS